MSKSTTTTQKNDPPAWAKPLLEQSATDAQKLYNQDKGFNVYQGDRVANTNAMQTNALRSMADATTGYNNADTRAAGAQFDRLMGGRDGQSLAAQRTFASMADGETATSDAALAALRGLQGGTNGTTNAALSTYGKLANGQSDGARTAGGLLGMLQNQWYGSPPPAASDTPPSSGLPPVGPGGGSAPFPTMGEGVAENGVITPPQARSAPLSAAEQYLTSTAKGDNLYGDARFQEMLDRQSQKIADQVGQQFNAAGRYNSGANQAVLASNVGDFRRNTILDNYGQERQRQLAAVGAIDAGRQNVFGNQMSLAQAQNQLGQQQFSNQANVAAQRAALGQQQFSNQSNIAGQRAALGQQLFANQADIANARNQIGQQTYQNQMAAGQAQQNLGNMLFQNQLAGANAGLQAGTFKQQQDQANIDAQMAKFREKDMQDWTRLGALQAAASGAAGPYGMMQSTQQTPFNPLGLLGALGGLFSDRRLKQDIQRVGSANGFPLYEFAYRVAPGKRYRGVMAQDVVKKRPDAISYAPDGMMMVNYAALGLTMEAA